jgi:hypothetical protein
MLNEKPYVVRKFEAGEVHFKDGAAGWLMDDGEFRPLMDDAMAELHSAEQIAEERFEARAAMGPGVEMVNIITGERYTT